MSERGRNVVAYIAAVEADPIPFMADRLERAEKGLRAVDGRVLAHDLKWDMHEIGERHQSDYSPAWWAALVCGLAASLFMAAVLVSLVRLG